MSLIFILISSSLALNSAFGFTVSITSPLSPVHHRYPVFSWTVSGASSYTSTVELRRVSCNIECNLANYTVNNANSPLTLPVPLDANATYNYTVIVDNGTSTETASELIFVQPYTQSLYVQKISPSSCSHFDLFEQLYLNNSHSALAGSNYPYSTCVDYFGNVSFAHTCSGYYKDVLDLYQDNNSHVILNDTVSGGIPVCIQSNMPGVWSEIISPTSPAVDYSCLFSFVKDWIGNAHVFSCDVSSSDSTASKVWLSFVQRPEITNISCGLSTTTYNESSNPYLYCNVSYYLYGNPLTDERYINGTVYYLNGTYEKQGNQSTWNTSRLMWVDSHLEGHNQYCYAIKARNSIVETQYSQQVCYNVSDTPPFWYAPTVNPRYANKGQLITVYVKAEDIDGDLLRLVCGNESGNYNLCTGNWESSDPKCNFTSPWDDGKEHSIYCAVQDNYDNSSSGEFSLAIKSISNITVGQLKTNASIVKNNDLLKVTLISQTGLNVELNTSGLNDGVVKMYDDGTNGDETANDGIYTAIVPVHNTSLSATTDITAKASNVFGQSYEISKTITIDNKAPTITVNSPQTLVFNPQVYFNISTDENATCYLNNAELSGNLIHTYLFNAQNGNNSVNISCYDVVHNENSMIFNFTVNSSPLVIHIVSPVSHQVVRGIIDVNYTLRNTSATTLTFMVDNKKMPIVSCGQNCISFNTSQFGDGEHTLSLIATMGNQRSQDSVLVNIENNFKIYFLNPLNNSLLRNDTNVSVYASGAAKVHFVSSCSLDKWDNTSSDGFKVFWALPNSGICKVNASAYDSFNQFLGSSEIQINVSKQYSFTLSIIQKSLKSNEASFLFNTNADYLKVYYSFDNSSWDFVKQVTNYVDFSFPENHSMIYLKVVAYHDVFQKAFYFNFTIPKLSVTITTRYVNQLVKGNTTFNFTIYSRYALTSLDYVLDSKEVTLGLTNRSFTIDTLKLLDGTHSLKVEAKDSYGNTAEDMIYFVVKNVALLDISNLYNNKSIYGQYLLYFVYPTNTYNLKLYINSTLEWQGLDNSYILNTSKYSDGTYNFTLIAYNNLGEEIRSVSYNVIIHNAILPAPTLELRDKYDSDGIIHLNWTSVPGAVKYKIYRSESNGTFYPLITLNGNNYVDFVNDGIWRYYVVALDYLNREGNKSNVEITYVKTKKVMFHTNFNKDYYKPNDYLIVTAYSTDPGNFSISIPDISLQGNFTLINNTPNGYEYEYVTKLGSFSMSKYVTAVVSFNDSYGFVSTSSKELYFDSQSPTASLSLGSIGSAGFEEYNKSVTVTPLVYFNVNAYDKTNVKCLVSEGKIYSLNHDLGYPFTKTYAENVSSKNFVANTDSGFVFMNLILNANSHFSLGNLDASVTNGNLNVSGKLFKLHRTNYSELGKYYFASFLLLFNSSSSKVIVGSSSADFGGMNVSTISLNNLAVSNIIVSNSTSYNAISSCSGYIDLSGNDGKKLVSALVYDNAGNPTIVNSSIILNKNGSLLDVTPPSAPTVKAEQDYVNSGNVSFYWFGAKDREQEMLKLPLLYNYQLYVNGNLVLSNYTEDTRKTFQISVSNGDIIYLKVAAVNSAGLKSSYAQSNNVTVDLIAPVISNITTEPYVNFSSWFNIPTLKIKWKCTDAHLEGSYFLLSRSIITNPLYMFFTNSFNTTLAMNYNGVNYFNLVCVDKAGNKASANVTLNYDSIHPVAPRMQEPTYSGSSVLFKWDPAQDNVGIAKYELRIYDAANNLVEDVNTTNTYYLYKPSVAGKYTGLVRAFDYAGNPSLWSNNAGKEYDATPPNFLWYGPQGLVYTNMPQLTVKTDDVAVCYYLKNGNMTPFLFTNSTYHKMPLVLPSYGVYSYNVTCINDVGLESSKIITFNYSQYPEVNDVVFPLHPRYYSTNKTEVKMIVTKDTVPVSNLVRSDFKFTLTDSYGNAYSKDYAFTDYANGTYSLTFDLSAGNYTLDLTVLGYHTTYHFEVYPVEVNFDLNVAKTYSSRNIVYGTTNGYILGLGRRTPGVKTSSSNVQVIAKPNSEFDMFFLPKNVSSDVDEKQDSLMIHPDTNYALPVSAKKIIALLKMNPNFEYEIDPALYNMGPGNHRIVIKKVGYDDKTNKTIVKITMLY